MAETSNPAPSNQPKGQPNFDLLDSRIAKLLDERGLVHGGGGGDMGGMAHDEKVSKLEIDVASIKGALDWAKIAASVVSAVTLGGFAIIVTMLLNLSAKVETQGAAVSAKIDNIRGDISEEFRALRSDQSAQVSAIAGAISATKNQTPQVMILPEVTPGTATPPASTQP